MKRARALVGWPLLGVVLIVSAAFALSSVRTRAAAEEGAEVSAGVITPAPPITDTTRPGKKFGVAATNSSGSRTMTPRATASTVDRKLQSDKSGTKTEPETASIRPPTAQGALASPAPAESLAGVGLKLLLGSLVLAALLYAASRWLKRLPLGRFLPGTDGPIKVIGRTHLGPKASLCLVEVGSTTLLVSMTGTTIQTLHVWPDGATATPGTDRQGFKSSTTTAAAPAAGQLRQLESRLTGRNG